MTDHSPAGTGDRPRVAVGVCTYRRADSLLRTVRHVAASLAQAGLDRRTACVVVVDNDGQDPSVGERVAQLARELDLSLVFEVEREPGIAAARNRVFALADASGARFMAMLDDDEWPAAGWIGALLETQSRSGATVVGGPVSPVFPPGRADLARYARYWSVMPQLLDGRPFVFCTCNFLIDLQAIRSRPRPLFDPAFGLSGGGDTVFFRGLFHDGHAMAWSERALMHEEVPPSRASTQWIRTRRFRVGNHAVHWEQVGREGWRSLAKTLGLTVRLPLYPLFGREPESRWFGWLLEWDKVRGRYAAHLGRHFVEYGRPTAAGGGAGGSAGAGAGAGADKACR